MNRDELAAIGRAAITLIAGAAILYAIGHWLGWWVAGAVFVSGVAYGVWWLARLPVRMLW